ncbi:MAG: GHMP family kinase ATP-binding protein [Candidatus Zipacnadales bacterium]
MVLRSRAPVRIDFAGGTTDLKAFRDREGGAVLSGAVARYAYCSLRERANGLRIEADDLQEYVEAEDIRDIEHKTGLELLTKAIQRFGIDSGISVTVRTDAPPGSGTGSSASVGVALLGILEHRRALFTQTKDRLSRYDLAEMACEIEEEMGIVGGKQDQYAAAVGGINYLEFHGDQVSVERVEVSPGLRADLEKHLVLCYSGKSRLSGDTNTKMISAYENGEPTVTESLRTVKRVAKECAQALRGEDMARLADLLNEEFEARVRLAEGVLTDEMADMVVAARAAGARAVKICGAGGGGCLLFLAGPDCEGPVRRALEERGGRILDFVFDFEGLQCWAMDE